MSRIKNTFMFVCIVGFHLYMKAQTSCTSSLYGKVLDDHTHEYLEFASVSIVELNLVSKTDNYGKYKFDNICDGNYTIRINHFDCKQLEIKTSVKGKTRKDFYPEHHAHLLDEVNIINQKPEDKTTQTKTDLTEKEMNESMGQSLGDALKNKTGVTSINTGSSISKPVIHGLSGNRILIMNNGVRLEGQQWGNEHAPEIDPFIAGNISVIKGAASVRYGSDAMAGVVLINSKPMRDSAGINGELNLVGTNNGKQGTTSGYIDGKFSKLSPFAFRLQGTFKQGGNIFTPNYMLKNTGLREHNFSYALQWKKQNYGADLLYSQFNTTIGIFSGSHIGNLTDLQNAFNSATPRDTSEFTYKIVRPFQHIEHELVKFNFFVNTGDLGKLKLNYARQYNLRYEYDKHRPLDDSLEALNVPELQFEITTHTADLVWEHNRIRTVQGLIGVSGMTQGNTYEGRFFIPNFRNYAGGVYWIERFKKPKYEIEAGVRYDYKWLQIFKYENNVIISPIRKFNNLSGTVGGIYKVDSSFTVSYNFGTAWRAPNVNELYSNGLHHGAASIEIGDRNLNSETAFNNTLTFNYKYKQLINIEASGYYNIINNFIYLQPVLPPTLTIHGAFPTFYYKQVNATMKGIDAYAQIVLLKKVEITTKASLLYARNNTIDDWLILMPSNRFETEISWNFKDTKHTQKTYLSLAAQYVTMQNRVPVNSDFAPPPAEYFLINAEASMGIKVKKQTVIVGLGIRNALNITYRDYMDRFRYYTDAIGRSISVRIKIPFYYKSKKQTNKK